MPPSLHFENGNPHIDFDGSPFFVNTTLRPWDAVPGRPRCAAVSSFGLSGTNAHMVIEEAPVAERRHAARPGYLIVVSARGAEQLRAQAGRLVEHCAANPALDLGNTSFTLLMGRKHFEHRLACVARSAEELAGLLTTWLDTGATPQVFVSAPGAEEHREQVSLRRYGEQCIEDCCQGGPEDGYLERLSTLADLHSRGYALSFGRLFADGGYARVRLPVYPLARERYWVDSSPPDVSDSPVRPDVHEVVNGHAPAGRGAEPPVGSNGHEPDAVNDHIIQFLTSELGIASARVHVNRKLHELGIDSLMGRRLVRSLEEKFSVHISGKQLLDNPTIGALSALATRMLPSNGKVISPHGAKPGAPSAERLLDGSMDAERLIALIEQGSIL
jgi:acyl transferase domain-containing protein